MTDMKAFKSFVTYSDAHGYVNLDLPRHENKLQRLRCNLMIPSQQEILLHWTSSCRSAITIISGEGKKAGTLMISILKSSTAGIIHSNNLPLCYYQ